MDSQSQNPITAKISQFFWGGFGVHDFGPIILGCENPFPSQDAYPSSRIFTCFIEDAKRSQAKSFSNTEFWGGFRIPNQDFASQTIPFGMGFGNILVEEAFIP